MQRDLRKPVAISEASRSGSTLRLYESQQPPLYYSLLWPIARLIIQWPLPEQVWVLRLLTALIGSLAIPLAYRLGHVVFGHFESGLAAALIVAAMPEFAIFVTRIGNDSLALSLSGLFVLHAISSVSKPPNGMNLAGLGFLLGLCLLSKAYLLCLIPLHLVVMISCFLASGRSRSNFVSCFIWPSLACVAVSGWWYWNTFLHTGSLTGEQIDVAALRFGLPKIIGVIPRVPWLRAIDFGFTSYIWLGGWSFLSVRSWMYRVIEVIWAIAAVGCARTAFANRRNLFRCALLILPCLCLLLGLAYQTAEAQLVSGRAGTFGYYLLGLAPVEAVIFGVGLAGFAGPRFVRLLLKLTVVVFLSFETFGLWFLMLPYYAGFIGHDATNLLRAWKITSIKAPDLFVLFERLGTNGIGFVSADGLIFLALLFVITNLSLILLSSVTYSAFQRRKDNAY